MNRMALIAVALCAVLLGTVGAGVVVARQEPQKGNSRVYQYDVIYGEQIAGKLIINTKTHTYVINGKGIGPGITYRLWYAKESANNVLELIRPFDAAVANNAGNVHIEGAWVEGLDLGQAPVFTIRSDVMAGSGLDAILTKVDGSKESGGQWFYFNALASTGTIVWYRLEKNTEYSWGGSSNETVYDGKNAQLNETNVQGYALFVPDLRDYMIELRLTVWDSAGASDVATYTFMFPA